jgi:peptidoglycan/LPS O-acetylase OafA/YrhL
VVETSPPDRILSAPRLNRMPALDGYRAVGFAAFLAYHSGFTWLPGTFYGVDSFFVLSGFLITSLLIGDIEKSGTVRLQSFWVRRARRLLPAMFLMVAVVGLVHLAAPSVLPWTDPVPDALATVFYVANWHFIASGASYFAATGPRSPLLPTWSLAIEEQFYLIWPLVVLVVLGRRAGRTVSGQRRRLWLLGGLCVAGACASAAWMWHLTPNGANLTRAYYGTDSRAQALLVGGALAVALTLYTNRSTRVRRTAGAAGVVGLLGSFVMWHVVSQTSAFAFHGGYLVAEVAAAAIFAGGALSPAGPATRVLSLRPLAYFGRITYGAYLWYFPVVLVMTPSRIHLGPWPLYAAQFAVVIAIAAVSNRFLEMPIRRGSLPGWRALAAAPLAAGLAVTAVVCSAVFTSSAAPPVVPPPAASSVRVLLVGDSMAGSLGATLATEAHHYGVEILNEGHPGCSVTTDTVYQFLIFRQGPGPPCRIGDPTALLDQWRHYISDYRPQVVVFFSRAQLVNQDINGSWTWIGHPAFDRRLESQLTKGIRILGSEGAHVVLLTSPLYYSTIHTTPPSPMAVEDTPHRVTDYNRILASLVAATHNPRISTFPLGKVLDPDGSYQGTVDGVAMRCYDGVHLSVTAGKVIAPRLLPYLVRLGKSTVLSKATDPPREKSSLPPVVPDWYDKLQCGQ